MRFFIIYQHDVERRKNVIKTLEDAVSKGVDFTKQELEIAGMFVTRKYIPSIYTLNLPLNIQVEEIEYKEKQFISRRQLIIDIEVEVKSDVPK